MLWLLVDDLYRRTPTLPLARTAFLASYKNPLLKYYDNNDNDKRAKSVLYVPYWNKRGVAKFPSKGSSNKDRVFYKDDADNIFFCAAEGSWSGVVNADQRFWTKGQCKLRYKMKDVLAVNLFTNIIAGGKNDFHSPRDLAVAHTTHKDVSNANPCLAIVCVTNSCTGSSGIDEKEWPARFKQIYNSPWFKNQNMDPEVWTESRPNPVPPYPDGYIQEKLADLGGMEEIVTGVAGMQVDQDLGNINPSVPV